MSRPLIGVSCMNVGNDRGELIGQRPTYLRALEAAGAIPLLIQTTDDVAAIRALYDLCAGILIPGGGDIEPSEFGEQPHPEISFVDPQRDRLELQLARWTRDDNKPLLGICRGIQVINVAFGGTLYQDIPSQLPGSLDHRYNTNLQKYDVPGHDLTLAADSWLAERLGTTALIANTMHHQSLKDLAPGLRIVGQAPDGIVEAVEGTGTQLVIGVQCHPEHLWREAEPRWTNMFRAFVDACR
ncbi:MAG: gamma-glutamyl-gamma-aminobutyrate hydrolase family protein [Blastochloris sp.]|nr:gamma-glutamyl-gamma-aminobutyrate hydrolase family protein [Blastochloris sp.]